MLSEALAHLEKGGAANDEAALRLLLEAWRAERVPALAELIELLSVRITNSRDPILGRTVKVREERWVEIESAHDACDVGRLLETPWPGVWQEARKRLDRIAKWPGDPRVAMALARVADEVPFKAWRSHSFYELLLRSIETIGDLRVLDVLGKKTRQERPQYYQGRNFETEKVLVERLTLLSASDQQRQDTLRVTTSAAFAGLRECFRTELTNAASKKKGEQDFLDAIFKDPADDGVRQVYADFLSERGDPRGELITLQLANAAGTATDAMIRREHALVVKHGRTFAGPLDDWCEEEGRTFERGFLARATLARTVAARLEEVLAHPAWATVHTIDVSPVYERVALILATTPFASRLRALLSLQEPDALWLARGEDTPPAARTLEEIGFSLRYRDPQDPRAVLVAPGLPALRRLVVRLYHSEDPGLWLSNGPLWTTLEHLTVSFTANVVAWLAPARTSLSSLVSLTIIGGSHHGGWHSVFSNDAKGGRLRSVRMRFRTGPSRARWIARDLVSLLTMFAQVGISELVIEDSRALRPTVADRASFEEALARLKGLDRLEVPWDRPNTATAASKNAKTTTTTDADVDTYSSTTPGLRLDFIAVEPLLPKIDELIADIARAKLAPPFDSFAVNRGIHRSLTKKDPVTQLLGWAKKPRTYHFAIYRDGMRDRCDFGVTQYTRGHFICGARTGTASDEAAFVKEYIAWVLSLLDRHDISWGMVQMNASGPELDLFRHLEHADKRLSWITIFGPQYEPLFPREDLVKLPASLDGVSVHLANRNVMLVNAPLPSTTINNVRARPIEQALTEIYARNFTKTRGYDPRDHIATTLEKTMTTLGYTRTPGLAQGSFGWTRRAGLANEGVHGVLIDLLRPIASPTLRVWYKADVFREDLGLSTYWDRQQTLQPEHGTTWAAASREEIDASLTKIADHVKTDIDAWLTKSPRAPNA